MVVNPKECLEPSPSDIEIFELCSTIIDKRLLCSFTDPSSVVKIFFYELTVSPNDKIQSLIKKAYNDAGWLVELKDDSYFDPRDQTTVGSKYFQFSICQETLVFK